MRSCLCFVCFLYLVCFVAFYLLLVFQVRPISLLRSSLLGLPDSKLLGNPLLEMRIPPLRIKYQDSARVEPSEVQKPSSEIRPLRPAPVSTATPKGRELQPTASSAVTCVYICNLYNIYIYIYIYIYSRLSDKERARTTTTVARILFTNWCQSRQIGTSPLTHWRQSL